MDAGAIEAFGNQDVYARGGAGHRGLVFCGGCGWRDPSLSDEDLDREIRRQDDAARGRTAGTP
jgi:hypothetical protein